MLTTAIYRPWGPKPGFGPRGASPRPSSARARTGTYDSTAATAARARLIARGSKPTAPKRRRLAVAYYSARRAALKAVLGHGAPTPDPREAAGRP